MAKLLTNIEYLENEIVATRRQLLTRVRTKDKTEELKLYWSRLVKAWREVKTLEAVIV